MTKARSKLSKVHSSTNYLGHKARFDRLEGSATILNRLLKRLGVDSLYRDNLHLNIVRDIWPEVVGEKLAKLCRCVKLENGTLLISVSSPTIRHHLASNSQVIINKFNAAVAKGKLAAAYDDYNANREAVDSQVGLISSACDNSRYKLITLDTLTDKSPSAPHRSKVTKSGSERIVVRSLAFKN